MRVRAKVATFLDNTYRKEGDEFDYTGPHNDNLEPVDKADKEKADKEKAKEEKAKEDAVKDPPKPNDFSKHK